MCGMSRRGTIPIAAGGIPLDGRHDVRWFGTPDGMCWLPGRVRSCLFGMPKLVSRAVICGSGPSGGLLTLSGNL